MMKNKICKKLLCRILRVNPCELPKNELVRLIKTDPNINWIDLCSMQTLSENFIREFKDQVNWAKVSTWQVLSEDFIREFQDRVDWYGISFAQNLSENFIREFQNKVNWRGILLYQKLSPEATREFSNYAENINRISFELVI